MGLGDMISGAGDAISSGVSKLKDWLGGDEESAGAENDPWAGLGRPFVEKKDIVKLDTEDGELGARTVPEPRAGHGVREEGSDAQGNELWHREAQTMTSNWKNFGPRKMGEARDLPHLDTTNEESDAVRTVPEDRPSHRTRPEGLVGEDGNLMWRRRGEKSGKDVDPDKYKLIKLPPDDPSPVTEYISVGGVRYKYQYAKPKAKDVAAAVESEYDGSIPYRGLYQKVYSDILAQNRKAARDKAIIVLTSFTKEFEDAKAEPGISRRINANVTMDTTEGNFDVVSPVKSGDGGRLTITPKNEHEHSLSDLDPYRHAVFKDNNDVTEDYLSLADFVERMMLESYEWRCQNRHTKVHKSAEDTKAMLKRMGRSLGYDDDDVANYSKSLDAIADSQRPTKVDVPISGKEFRPGTFGRGINYTPGGSSEVVNETGHELALRFAGFGDINLSQYQFFHNFNIFNKSFTPGGARELKGFTFITRPHLNLTNRNIAHVSRLTHLLQADNTSVSMYIRQMLDTSYADKYGGVGGSKFCPLLDTKNPFNVLLCNALVSINGFPDPDLTTESTSGGFFSEQQTNVIGYNRLAKGQDLQLEFKDYEGGIVLAMHDVWCQYAGYIADGQMMQYLDDIEDNIMGYTVSIYRFVTDHTGRFITRWAKATGCYPKLYPTGTPFNINDGEQVLSAVKRFTIPYWAHHFDYNNPEILMDFNELVKRYCPEIQDYSKRRPVRPGIINNNLMGIPYVEERSGRFELVFKAELEPTFQDDYDRKATLVGDGLDTFHSFGTTT